MRILDLLSFLTHPGHLLKEKTRMVLSSVKGEKGNLFRTFSSFLKKTHIRFSGSGHNIRMEASDVFNSTVFLRGSGHRLILDKGAKLYNVQLKMIGKNNLVHIKAGASVGGGSIICGGENISIVIGERCVLAEGVDIWSTDTHSITVDGELINPPRSILIGNHVWVGKDVSILKGVTIGDHAIIGMKSVVTHDIAAETLNVGSPTRVIRDHVEWSLKNPNNPAFLTEK